MEGDSNIHLKQYLEVIIYNTCVMEYLVSKEYWLVGLLGICEEECGQHGQTNTTVLVNNGTVCDGFEHVLEVII